MPRTAVGGSVDDASTDAAVREVFDAHYGRLVGWATRLVDDRDLAHDLVTEAFVRLLRSWASVDDPRPWLYATTANLVRDHWRKRGRERVAYTKYGVAAEAEPSSDLAAVVSVRDAVQALPDRLRMAVLLHYFGDLTVAQVAAQLGKSDGAVKRDLYDARSRMAAALEGVR